jgi:DNA-binding CsgD family transcriptional regulator
MSEAGCCTLGAPEERTLRLILGGLTDAAAAHRLGVSQRTVQRRIRILMDAWGCRNRMQLGRRAALAGIPAEAPEPGTEPEAPAGVPDEAGIWLLWTLLADVPAQILVGLSARSAERRVRELMSLAGARSRAELGWRATRLGWL